MNCNLVIGTSGFDYRLGFESNIIHTYVCINLATERSAPLEGMTRAWGKFIDSGQLLH